MKAVIKTYKDDELVVTLEHADGHRTAEYLLVRIGLDDPAKPCSLLILGNGKCYLSQKNYSIVYEDEELNISGLYQEVLNYRYLAHNVGAVSELTTNDKTIVGAINEIASAQLSTRELRGYAKWLVFDETAVDRVEFDDLDIAYVVPKKEWMYYSEALHNFTPLPVDWQNLDKIVRTRQELNDFIAVGTKRDVLVGVLEDSSVIRVWKTGSSRTVCPISRIGDEFIIQYIATKDGVQTDAKIICTPKGWVYILSKV